MPLFLCNMTGLTFQTNCRVYCFDQASALPPHIVAPMNLSLGTTGPRSLLSGNSDRTLHCMSCTSRNITSKISGSSRNLENSDFIHTQHQRVGEEKEPSGAEAEVEAPRCFRRVVAESEDAAAGAVVLSPSRHLPPFAAAPFPPEVSSPARVSRRLRRPCLQIMVDSDDEYYFKNFIDTSSEEESDDDFFTDAALLIHEHIVSQIPVHRGSLPGRAAALDRERERGHDQLFRDYFQPTPIFVPPLFRRRFRMSRPLFRRIMDGVKIYDDYFRAKVDALGKVGLSSYQKCTAAIRMLAYGVAGDFVDEYTRMSESTALESMYRFCRAVIGSFGEQYLRQPNAEDTARLLSINAARGFPGMLGSIDCMHWEWKNCPFGWQGAYSGHSEGCTVILEAVASHDTWIWHSFFGMAGSHNDINVLQRSPVFDRLAYGQSPDVDFEINGHHYTKGYYLADGIYPPWATLVKTIRNPTSEQEARFAKEQEAARKDVERAFGILQARWAIVRHPARAWDVQTLWEVMTACVIMHNMIVEVERDDSLFDNEWDGQGELVTPQGGPASFQDILHAHHEIRDLAVHNQLQADLVEHMWQHVGSNAANNNDEGNPEA
ncbi:hypothetical protein QYE76_031972 [Lolium multiflorum]|uniref:Uncharacterized protein n=1 Tax=Lolium multiflorum TaxID=4521 RepID=A0AAD8VIY2_LOLMU|nr:hypothetical protein QYE76_031972 [Lolium multiflorum]